MKGMGRGKSTRARKRREGDEGKQILLRIWEGSGTNALRVGAASRNLRQPGKSWGCLMSLWSWWWHFLPNPAWLRGSWVPLPHAESSTPSHPAWSDSRHVMYIAIQGPTLDWTLWYHSPKILIYFWTSTCIVILHWASQIKWPVLGLFLASF